MVDDAGPRRGSALGQCNLRRLFQSGLFLFFRYVYHAPLGKPYRKRCVVTQWLKSTIGNYEIWRIAAFFGAVFGALVVGVLARFSMQRAAKRIGEGKRKLAGLFLDSFAKPVLLLAFTVGLWLGVSSLNLKESIADVAATIVAVLYSVSIGYAIYKLVDIVDHYLDRLSQSTDSKVDDMLAPLVGKSIRITVFVLVILQVVQTVSNKPITSILAGLGVGGLAVALAAQDTIKNFFGSLVILGDKPFEVGDRIDIDGHDGPVEVVGFRSTKIRTLDGHLVTVPNSEMVNSTICNIGKRPYIKRVANITITYDTLPEKVEKAIVIVKDILKDHEGMSPDFPPRVYFSDFNDWALNIMVIYWYHPPDYWQYMEFSEKVNLQILTRFNNEGIEFAFPSQTLYHANDDKRQLAIRMLETQK